MYGRDRDGVVVWRGVAGSCDGEGNGCEVAGCQENGGLINATRPLGWYGGVEAEDGGGQ